VRRGGGASEEEAFAMLQIVRKVGWSALLALSLSLLFAAAASAQMREFTGMVNKIDNKKIIVDNRMGDKVSFNKLDDTEVVGEKTAWDAVKKDDWVTIYWKFVDKPRKAYKVEVLPPRNEAGEDE
jgi:hypothetical protein